MRFNAQTDPVDIDGLPVGAPATLLVHLAARPTDVRSWSAFEPALPDLVDRAPVEALAAALEGRPAAVGVRLGYLLTNLAPTLTAALGLTAGAGVVWFGPRTEIRRFDRRWNVGDTVLPFDPREPCLSTSPT